MSKTSAVILTAVMFWPAAGWLAYLIIVNMWLQHADAAPMSVQIIGGITVTCAIILLFIPIYASLFLVSPVMPAKAGGGKKDKQNQADEGEDFSAGGEDDFGGDGDFKDASSEDFDAQNTNEFETVEFSDEFSTFDESFADEDDDPFK